MPSEFALGTIPARGFSWEDVAFEPRRLSEVVTLRYGKSLPEPKRHPGSVPVYGTNGVCGWHAEALAQGPGVILGRKGQGHLGVEWCDSDFWVIDTAYYAEIDEDQADSRWFYYLTNYVGLDHLKTGEKPGLQRDVFGAQVVPFPPLDEQRRIAGVLTSLDDTIALDERLSRTLESAASALFRSWFVDFDPVVAKAEGRRAMGVPDAVHELMPPSFSLEGAGEIPVGWSRCPLSDLLSVEKVGVSPSETPETLFDHYSLPAFDSGRLPVREPGGAIRSGKFRVPPTALLVSKLNPQTPRIWWPARGIDEHSICSTEFMPCVPRPGVPKEFLYELLRSSLLAEEMAGLVTGTSNSHQRVKPEDFARIQVVVPTEDIMRRFAAIVGPLLERSRQSLLRSATLATIRDTLLPLLLSGALRIGAVEQPLFAGA